MPSARINGIDFYYETHGEGPAIVFAHGGGGNHLSWWQQVPELSRHYRCVTFDHRGFGFSHDLSDGPGPGAFVEDLRQLLDHLGISRAALAGQSMGGWTVLGFAAAYPDRVSALVLCDTTAGMDDPEVTRAQAQLRESSKGANLANILTRAYATSFPERDPRHHFLYQQISGLNLHVPSTLLKALMGAKQDVEPIIRARIPTMLIVGEEDALVAPSIMQVMAQRLTGSRFVTIRGAGHSAYFEQPEEFNRVLSTFLREANLS
ncbi:MAG TPA: alpha/beta fold hydrolase [Candidatus Binataceae bacterium]|jgi:3-oxoadipate enol-lactonase|nr:alpha/beta fold hydrolase [Candidatus Binataceae bacterium]